MRKPTIVGDNHATRELFTHREHVYAVPMNDPAALAGAISALADDAALRSRIASGGYRAFQRHASTPIIADQLREIVSQARDEAAP